MKKRLLKHPAAQAFFAWFLAGFIRLVYTTSSKRRHIHPDALPYVRGEKNGIFAFWHGRMMLMPCFEPPNRAMHVLISSHGDGRLISRVISHFGVGTISGSSSKGGKAAASKMIAALLAGDNVTITPDGPRGPNEHAAAGITRLAALTGYPIIPATFHSTRHIRLGSWDKFMLALPFGKVTLVVDAPLCVQPAEARQDMERIRQALQSIMRRQTQLADATHKR